MINLADINKTEAVDPVFSIVKAVHGLLIRRVFIVLLYIHFAESCYMILLDQDLFFIEVIFNVFIFIDKCTHRR